MSRKFKTQIEVANKSLPEITARIEGLSIREFCERIMGLEIQPWQMAVIEHIEPLNHADLMAALVGPYGRPMPSINDYAMFTQHPPCQLWARREVQA